MENIVVESDLLPVFAFSVESCEHLVKQLPAPLTGKDEVAVLKPAAGTVHDVHGFIKAQFQVGFFCEQRIICADDGAGSRMDRYDAVVLCDLLCKRGDLVFFNIAVGFIHKPK